MPNRTALLPLSLLLLTTLLSGCKAPVRPQVTGLRPTATPTEQPLGRGVQHLQQCQQQLKILSTLQDVSYPPTQREFDRLMRGAAQYAGLRTRVNESTQDTVDALYRYRVNLLCAQINQAVLNRLAEKGGATS